jgi:transcription elongation factor GreA-like protein
MTPLPDIPVEPAGVRVRHRSWGVGTVLHAEQDRITVMFEAVGYRTLSLAAVEEQDLLTQESARSDIPVADSRSIARSDASGGRRLRTGMA